MATAGYPFHINIKSTRVVMQPRTGTPHLRDDLHQCRCGEQPIVDHRNRDARTDIRRGNPGEVVLVERSPVTAMQEYQQRIRSPRRREEIQPLGRRRAIGQIEASPHSCAHLPRVPLPAREEVREFRHLGPGIVLSIQKPVFSCPDLHDPR